ncbi:hypothetical protein NC651_034200 [Populus alba x Populus x berolinensis]|nr:hypothetical protein NC651_034200 [Populus alba x Populus x berolinensis]
MVLLLLLLMLVFDVSYTQAFPENGNKIKSRTFLSPEFMLGPGSVESKTFDDIDFPRGHITLKSFNAEVVDQDGNPVPLYDTYIHHWLVGKYYENRTSDRNFSRNSGLCQDQILGQYFGLGSETRKTATHIPDPFGIQIGNPAEIPEGYQEKWYLGVHAIETRGAEDRLGCIECWCDLYNVTNDEYGNPIRPDYKGGLFCCYGQTQCKVRQGFQGGKRSLYLRYTVKWIEWDSSTIPVEIFVLDATDTGKRLLGSTGISPENGCQVEYEVESCTSTDAAGNGCIDIKRNSVTMPTGGYVIYAVAHQHAGGIGSTLYGQDGNVICASIPIYGNGNEAGNEDGYIVGMSTCYPEPGSVKITAGENLTLESNYNSTNKHTGVMGFFYIYIAEQAPNVTFSQAPVQMHESNKVTANAWSIVVFIGLAVTIAVAVHFWLKKRREGNMVLLLLLSILAFDVSCTQAFLENGNKIKSKTFLSPEFMLGPGSVESKTYDDIDFPRGHIALKSFNAEVVDQAGNPVPLYDTYIHHWLVGKYYENRTSDRNFSRNSGLCQGQVLGQYFGLGSETRKTASHIPDPFGIQTGNPVEIPEGYQEKWYLGVHAIETRGAEDRLGCTECWCDLYNVTNDEDGNPIRPDYKGGLFCCYGQTQCKVRQGFQGGKRSLYLRYTVKWIDWDSSTIPVEIVVLDVTDTGKRLLGSTGISPENGCQVEYAVESCTATDAAGNGCIDIKRNNLTMPTGGYVIYAVAHQHAGGIGSTLYGQDGNVICTSIPIYGNGNEAGNEDGYIVGMSACYPEPGSVKITAGENLTLESKYNSTNKHTGVMGLFYIYIAEQAPNVTFSQAPVQMHESIKVTTYAWSIVVFIGLAVTIAVAVHSWLKKRREGGYKPVPK